MHIFFPSTRPKKKAKKRLAANIRFEMQNHGRIGVFLWARRGARERAKKAPQRDNGEVNKTCKRLKPVLPETINKKIIFLNYFITKKIIFKQKWEN